MPRSHPVVGRRRGSAHPRPDRVHALVRSASAMDAATVQAWERRERSVRRPDVTALVSLACAMLLDAGRGDQVAHVDALLTVELARHASTRLYHAVRCASLAIPAHDLLTGDERRALTAAARRALPGHPSLR